jgi:hypothetical protein
LKADLETWFWRIMGFLVILFFGTGVWLFMLAAFDVTVKYFRSFH